METKTEKTGKLPKARQINLRLARVLFRQAWNAENPGASVQDRKAAFKGARNEYLKKARNLRGQLKKSGVELNLAAEVPKGDEAMDASA